MHHALLRLTTRPFGHPSEKLANTLWLAIVADLYVQFKNRDHSHVHYMYFFATWFHKSKQSFFPNQQGLLLLSIIPFSSNCRTWPTSLRYFLIVMRGWSLLVLTSFHRDMISAFRANGFLFDVLDRSQPYTEDSTNFGCCQTISTPLSYYRISPVISSQSPIISLWQAGPNVALSGPTLGFCPRHRVWYRRLHAQKILLLNLSSFSCDADSSAFSWMANGPCSILRGVQSRFHSQFTCLIRVNSNQKLASLFMEALSLHFGPAPAHVFHKSRNIYYLLLQAWPLLSREWRVCPFQSPDWYHQLRLTTVTAKLTAQKIFAAWLLKN